MRYNNIIYFGLLLYVVYSLFMFYIEKRMNNDVGKYSIECLIVNKEKVGTRTKRTYLQFNNNVESFDSDKLYNENQIGEKIKMLYFQPLDILMLPNSKNYLEMFLFSLIVALLVKSISYFKNL